MEINVEISFLVNFALNFFILKLASLFLRKQLKSGFISAFIASIIALLSPLITAVYLKKIPSASLYSLFIREAPINRSCLTKKKTRFSGTIRTPLRMPTPLSVKQAAS